MRIHRSSLAAALLACLLFLSRESRAEPHARDGFYLQLATGLGAAFWHSSGHNPHYTPALDFSGTQSGAGLNGSLLLGLPLRPGLSLGVGGLASTIAITSSTHETQDENPQLQLFGAVGPFVDFYPTPTSGWHVQALVGYAALGEGHSNTNPPNGIGLMAGVGQDWWLSDRWSVGILARVVYASTHLTGAPYPDHVGGSFSEHDTLLSPSVEASFTFH